MSAFRAVLDIAFAMIEGHADGFTISQFRRHLHCRPKLSLTFSSFSLSFRLLITPCWRHLWQVVSRYIRDDGQGSVLDPMWDLPHRFTLYQRHADDLSKSHLRVAEPIDPATAVCLIVLH